MLSSRFVLNSFNEASNDPNLFVGSKSCCVFALCVRSVIMFITASSDVFTSFRRDGSACCCRACCANPKMLLSELAMCSTHSAMDQLLGSALKLSCSGDSPFTFFKRSSLVSCRYLDAKSRSASVSPGDGTLKLMVTNATIKSNNLTCFISEIVCLALRRMSCLDRDKLFSLFFRLKQIMLV